MQSVLIPSIYMWKCESPRVSGPWVGSCDQAYPSSVVYNIRSIDLLPPPPPYLVQSPCNTTPVFNTSAISARGPNGGRCWTLGWVLALKPRCVESSWKFCTSSIQVLFLEIRSVPSSYPSSFQDHNQNNLWQEAIFHHLLCIPLAVI